MTLQICPVCQAKDSLWYGAEDNAGQEITRWNCLHCNYQAQENEQLERPCSHCADGRESHLTDAHRVYWWCFRCHHTITIETFTAT
jgi:Zn ribbon nucleic-acid-binding protein